MRFSCPYKKVEDILDDEQPQSIGSPAAVHAAVLAAFPGTDWSDPEWGRWDSEYGSIEFNVGGPEPMSMMPHVRAADEVAPGIVRLCTENHWQAIDCSMGDLFEQRADPTLGLKSWRAYLDRVMRDDLPSEQA